MSNKSISKQDAIALLLGSLGSRIDITTKHGYIAFTTVLGKLTSVSDTSYGIMIGIGDAYVNLYADTCHFVLDITEQPCLCLVNQDTGMVCEIKGLDMGDA